MDIYYIYIIGVRIFFFFFLFAINSHNLSLKSFDSKSLNTAVCSRRSLLHFSFFLLFFFFFFSIRNRRFVKSNLYFDRKSRILSSLDDHIRIFVSIEKFTGSKIRSDLYIFLSFSSPSLPYCIHARNLSSPLKHQVKHPRDASLLLLPHSPNKPNKMHSLSTRLRFSLFVSLEPESPSEISLSLSPTALPSPLLLLPLGERDRAPPTNWKGEALREGRRENALHSINISVWIGKPLRRDRVESSRSGRERARERRLCDARFEYYCLLLHSRATTEESVRKASSRRWKRRKERKRERKKNGPLAMPIFIPSSIVERENDPSLPLLQFEARLRVGSSSS